MKLEQHRAQVHHQFSEHHPLPLHLRVAPNPTPNPGDKMIKNVQQKNK